jgi:hypothetical protein
MRILLTSSCMCVHVRRLALNSLALMFILGLQLDFDFPSLLNVKWFECVREYCNKKSINQMERKSLKSESEAAQGEI